MEMPEELLTPSQNIAERFRGFLPVVVDVETGGFDSRTDALLEIAAVILEMDFQGNLQIKETYSKNIDPFPGANVEQAALEFTGIDLYDPSVCPRKRVRRYEISSALSVRRVSATGCTRAVMVAHNAHFDLGFVNAAVNRNQIKRNPFHPFSCFDTSSLAGWPMARQFWPKPVRRRVWILIIAMPTARSTIR